MRANQGRDREIVGPKGAGDNICGVPELNNQKFSVVPLRENLLGRGVFQSARKWLAEKGRRGARHGGPLCDGGGQCAGEEVATSSCSLVEGGSAPIVAFKWKVGTNRLPIGFHLDQG